MPGRTVNDLGGSASRKRARRPEDEHGDDNDEAVSVQGARSNPRQDGAKRVRLSDASPRKGKGKQRRETTPLDDDEDEDMEDAVVHRSPPKTQYDDMRDDDFRHLEHADADDYKATQNIMRMATRAEERLGDNLVAHNGILESITCVNFMCHERLHVELGPLLNFIVGENGSGKSAVLTAITLCLGGKATATNRGGSLKNFIKEGCDRASLSVKLKNQGDDSYRRDLYGDSIIVERTFSKSGNSGFKVKSAEGQTISTKKSEVDEVVEFYALQVDNPLNILSQDNARQFLNASSAAEKYRYFIEGVQLEQLDRDYRLISEFVGSSEAKAPLQKERVEVAQKEYSEAQRLNVLVQNSRRLKQKRRLMGSQLCWAQVTDEEKKAAAIERQLEEVDEQMAGIQRSIDTYTTKLENLDHAIAEKQAARDTAKEEAAHHEAGVTAVKSSFEEAQKQLQQMHNDERNAHSEASAAKKEVKRLEVEIKKEKAKLDAAQGDVLVRKREKFEDAKTRRDQVTQQAQSVRESVVKELTPKCEASQESLRNAKGAVEEKKREIQENKKRIEDILKGQGGKYDAYDRKIPELVRLIEKDNGWRERPIGPIGTHIQILQPRWTAILEKTLGGLLNDFIVTSKADQNRLQGHMRRLGISGPGSPSILIANGRPVDATGHEPDTQFDTVLRILKIDNDVVRSQLIIANSIEQILLIPERAKAEEIMFNDGGRPGRNIKSCLAFHDTRRNLGLLLQSKMGGKNISTSPVETNANQRPRMRAEQDSALSAQKESLEISEKELRVLLEQMQGLDKEHRQNVAQIQEKSKEAKALDEQVRDLNKEMDTISRQLDAFEGADVRLGTLNAQCEEQREKADHFSTQYAEIHINKEKYNKEVEAKKAALDEEKAQKKVLDKKVRDAEAEVTKNEHLRNMCVADKNALHEELDLAKVRLRQLQQKREEKDRDIKYMTAEASKQAPERPHIAEDDTHASLSAKYDSLSKQIAELQRQNGITDKEATELVAKTKSVLRKAEKDFEISTMTIERLKRTMLQRMDKWRLLQRFISAHARSSFAYLLRERRFRGQLLINHREKLLSLRVEPEKTAKSGQGRNTKTLSGGEKSFSSICLLLSIWESMGAPLRCLDEFDVFMDNVNRAVSTKMLMTAARRSVGRQYIFITPNAIDGKNSLDKDVKIIRLGDPRQRRLADP